MNFLYFIEVVARIVQQEKLTVNLILTCLFNKQSAGFGRIVT